MRKQKCLTPGCTSTDLVSRGLCVKHYHAAHRAQKKGLTTWTKLERHKLALPPAKFRRTGNKMTEAILGMAK